MFGVFIFAQPLKLFQLFEYIHTNIHKDSFYSIDKVNKLKSCINTFLRSIFKNDLHITILHINSVKIGVDQKYFVYHVGKWPYYNPCKYEA